MAKITKAESSKKYGRTKKGLCTIIYTHQTRNSKVRGHAAPTYSRDELREWMYSQELFHVLYDNWKRLDYQSAYRPSIDRKDDYIGYTMDNIQLMTWGENKAKGHADRYDGRNNKRSTCVDMFSLDGVFIESFHSASSAYRKTGVSLTNILRVCEGSRKTAGKLLWKYGKGTK